MKYLLQKLLDNLEMWLEALLSSIEDGFQFKNTLHWPAGLIVAASGKQGCTLYLRLFLKRPIIANSGRGKVRKKKNISPFLDASGNKNIGASIRIGQEIWFLQYAGFFLVLFWVNVTFFSDFLLFWVLFKVKFSFFGVFFLVNSQFGQCPYLDHFWN